MSRSMTPITRYTLFSRAARPSCSVARPGTSIALSKYLRKSSRPCGVRMPTRAPKSRPLGYAETKASGNTTSFAPLLAALAVSSRTLASVGFGSNTTGELCTTATLNGLDIPGNREQYRRKVMKISLLVLLFTSVFVSIVMAQTNQAQEVTMSGTLQGGRVAIGGETTGWALEYRDSTGPHSIEVELPGALAARARSGAMVKLTGTIVTREYVERGSTRILRVSRLQDRAAAAAPPPTSPLPRLPQLTIEQLNPQQRALADEILKISSVGLSGPYNSMLRSPEMGERMFKLLDYLRFNTSVPRRLNEFAILIQARLWTSQLEWLAHYPIALKEGLSEATGADLKAGRRPASMKPRETAV